MKDILVYADNYREWTRSMHYAAELASMLDTSLTGLYVQEPIVIPSSFDAPQLVAEWYRYALEEIQAAREFETKFRAWATDLGIKRNRWQVAEGLLPQTLAQATNWYDLLVLERNGDLKSESIGRIGQLLLTVGVPCIVVPKNHPHKASCKSIAIAWNSSAESVRAVHAALPLLKRAERVTLLQGKQALSRIRWTPEMDIETYLTEHDIHTEKMPITANDDDAGEALLGAAAHVGANMLVMGAYGKTRVSEWFFGGATRHVLECSTIPLFMRH